jgi:hypothetical protein
MVDKIQRLDASSVPGVAVNEVLAACAAVGATDPHWGTGRFGLQPGTAHDGEAVL